MIQDLWLLVVMHPDIFINSYECEVADYLSNENTVGVCPYMRWFYLFLKANICCQAPKLEYKIQNEKAWDILVILIKWHFETRSGLLVSA